MGKKTIGLLVLMFSSTVFGSNSRDNAAKTREEMLTIVRAALGAVTEDCLTEVRELFEQKPSSEKKCFLCRTVLDPSEIHSGGKEKCCTCSAARDKKLKLAEPEDQDPEIVENDEESDDYQPKAKKKKGAGFPFGQRHRFLCEYCGIPFCYFNKEGKHKRRRRPGCDGSQIIRVPRSLPLLEDSSQ